MAKHNPICPETGGEHHFQHDEEYAQSKMIPLEEAPVVCMDCGEEREGAGDIPLPRKKRQQRKPIKPEHVFPVAKRWWESHRPVGWTLSQHLSAPSVNCRPGVEAKLADVIAGDILAGRKENRR